VKDKQDPYQKESHLTRGITQSPISFAWLNTQEKQPFDEFIEKLPGKQSKKDIARKVILIVIAGRRGGIRLIRSAECAVDLPRWHR
jgi:hypothetical protein